MPYREQPNISEYPPYYAPYIQKVQDKKDVIAFLKKQQATMLDIINGVSSKDIHKTYAEGKWTIMQVLIHIIDTERVFAYRALSFVRGERQKLPGFDQDAYVLNADAALKSKLQIKEEYETNRRATIALFRGLDSKAFERTGTANNAQFSVRALLYIIAGHELHHMEVLKERYLH